MFAPLNTCFCGRRNRGFGFKHENEYWKFCSMEHQRQFAEAHKEGRPLKPANKQEHEAIQKAHGLVGKWLADKGQTDLAKMGYQDQIEFMSVVWGETCRQINLTPERKIGK